MAQEEKMLELSGIGGLLEAGVSERNLMFVRVKDPVAGGQYMEVELNRSQVAQLISTASQAGGVIN